MAAGGVFQTEDICVGGNGVRAWHVPGQHRGLVICRSCSDADGNWKGGSGLDRKGPKH